MHASLRLYDDCLTILGQESEALENEDEERLRELCEKRARLMEEAWRKKDGCETALLRERLDALRQAQDSLIARTRMQTQTLRLALENNRRESNRLAGYGKAVGCGQNAFLLRKEG
jgi:hypothetical protein